MSGLPAVALRVLRAEGLSAAMDRAWDRLLEARRRRSYTPVAAVPAGFRAPVLNLAATPPAPRLGGVQGQLLRRLEAEAVLRAVALLYPAAPAGSAAGGPEARRGGVGEGPLPPRRASAYRLELEKGGVRQVVAWLAGAAPGREGDAPERAGGALGHEGGMPGREGDASGRVSGAPGREGAVPGRDGSPPPPARDGEALARAVLAAAAAVGAGVVHVEGLAGLPFGALARLRQEGLGLIVSVHDFAAFCPRPHLLERVAPARFCHFSRDPQRCLSCLHHDWPQVDEGFQDRRRALAGEFLRAAAAVVYPSDYLRRTHLDLFPRLDPARQRVIEPPAADDDGLPLQPRPRPRTPPAALRHAAFIGSVNAHKGALVFEETLRRLAALPAAMPTTVTTAATALRFTVFGGGDAGILRRLRRRPGVAVRGYYRDGSLARRLASSGVELALLLSIVPESYGLALGECAAAGVPALTFAHGALGERVGAAGGLLLPAPTEVQVDAAALAALLGRLARGEQPLPPPPPRPLGTSAREAAEQWEELYRELGLMR